MVYVNAFLTFSTMESLATLAIKLYYDLDTVGSLLQPITTLTITIISLRCSPFHCLPYLSHLKLSDPDSQCKFERNGILCGQCQQSFSSDPPMFKHLSVTTDTNSNSGYYTNGVAFLFLTLQ